MCAVKTLIMRQTMTNPQHLQIQNALKFATKLRDNGKWATVEVGCPEGVKVEYGVIHNNGMEECALGHAIFYADGTHRLFHHNG